MTQDRMKALELERICKRVDSRVITLAEGLERAFALGAEFERLDIMHAACEGYSRVRAARENAMRGDSWPPPPEPTPVPKVG